MAKRKSAEEAGDQRALVPVSLTPGANEVINRWCDATGASKTKTVARLIEWFSRAPDSVQQMILGKVPEDMREDYIERAIAFFKTIAMNSDPAESGDPRLPHDATPKPRRAGGK